MAENIICLECDNYKRFLKKYKPSPCFSARVLKEIKSCKKVHKGYNSSELKKIRDEAISNFLSNEDVFRFVELIRSQYQSEG